jgi:hypothetical protein
VADKTRFNSQSESAPAELPAKCCGRCVHGRAIKDQVQLKSMIECYFGPPSAQLVQVQGGMIIKALRPVLSPISDCDQFSPDAPKSEIKS